MKKINKKEKLTAALKKVTKAMTTHVIVRELYDLLFAG